MKIKREIEVSKDHEGTEFPFWIIIDPKQNFYTNIDGVNNIAFMITGVWFSREAAEAHLKAKRHAYSKNAVVYCHSGCWSDDWKKLWGDEGR